MIKEGGKKMERLVVANRGPPWPSRLRGPSRMRLEREIESEGKGEKGGKDGGEAARW